MDLSPHLALKSPAGTGSVQIQGTQLVVDGVRPEQVQAAAGPVRRAAGGPVHAPSPSRDAPRAVIVLDWSPKEVTVEIVPSGNRRVEAVILGVGIDVVHVERIRRWSGYRGPV